VHVLDSREACCELEALDAVLDVFHPNDLDEPHVPRAPAVGPCARLDIPRDPDDPDLPSRRDAALVEREPVHLLCPGPVEVRDVDREVGHHHAVRRDLNLVQFFGRDVLVVPDIEARALRALLRPGLVDVGAEHLLCSMEEDVGRRVVAHQGPPALLVDDPLHPVAAAKDASCHVVEDDLAHLADVVDLDHVLRGEEHAGIGGLAATLGVEEGLVHDRVPIEEVEDHGIEFHVGRLLVVELLCRRERRYPSGVPGERVLLHFGF